MTILKNRRGLAEDKIDVALDIAIVVILPSVLCVERVLPAEKTAVSEDRAIGFDQHRDGLRAGPERILERNILGVKIVSADVVAYAADVEPASLF